MKRKMQGLLWLFLLEFALMAMSLEPGFLDFDNLPDTNFSCVGKVIGGYYADLETNCQMFHVCTIGQLDEPMDIRFLCLNGTVFDQETRVCERIDEVDCSKSEQFYSLNLELYGNTQPPILEESPEVEFPSDPRKATTTVQPTSSTATSTFAPFFPNTPPTTNPDISKVITSHHFPVNAPDIRFNPEEINISLKAGAPPDITRSQVPISYQQQSFSERNTRVTVTTHTTIYKTEKQNRLPILSTTNHPIQSITERVETKLTPKSVVSYGLTHNKPPSSNPSEINYGFSFPQTEESAEYHTEVPPHPYQYQLNLNNFRPHSAQGLPFHSSYRNGNRRQQKSNFPATTYRNHPAFTSSPRTPVPKQYPPETEKPPNLQLPLPVLPTLSPLSFSSPSPFSLTHHIETKRYTKDHQSPPRIIVSASASVSDNNGRRLNYSLGTIGASHFLGSSPASYDDYKEEDVILDPFYHDVPKLMKTRRRRSAIDNDDVIRDDKEAEDLLRYLFNWYKNRERSKRIHIPVSAQDITNINEQLAPVPLEAANSDDYNEMFRSILNSSINDIIFGADKHLSLNKSYKNESSKNHTRRNDKNAEHNNYLGVSSKNLHNEIQKSGEVVKKYSNTTDHLDEYLKESSAFLNAPTKNDEDGVVEYHENYPITLPSDVPDLSMNSTTATIYGVLVNTTDRLDEYLKESNSFVNAETKIDEDGVGEYLENYPITSPTDVPDLSMNSTTATIPRALVNITGRLDQYLKESNSFVNAETKIDGDGVGENHENDPFTLPTDLSDLTVNLTTDSISDYNYNESDYYYDYGNAALEVDTNSSGVSELVTTGLTLNVSDYFDLPSNDSFYEELDFVATTISSPNDVTTAALQTTILDKAQYSTAEENEIYQTETGERVQTEQYPKPSRDHTKNKEKMFVLNDYVDDNYEPLSYQVDRQVEVESNGGTLTTPQYDYARQNVKQPLTELEEFVITDLPTTVITEPPTTLQTEPPMTQNPETTVVTDSSVQTALYTNTESTTASVFSTTSTVTEPQPQPQLRKNEPNRKHSKHRFGSTNRNRETDSKTDSEPLVSTSIQTEYSSTILSTRQWDATTIATERKLETTRDLNTEMPLTDAPLLKSANPTKSKLGRIVLSTTPLTKVVRVDLIKKDSNQLRYSFNCFNKNIHRFYSDPRDCRLFHYCTLGYTKNQLVDVKFVCDLGTYYDEAKFICTKAKPARCL